MDENVLVVAFDGMDRELIEEYGLEDVKQEEFGEVDNHTGVTDIKTGELFASFITGETSDVHGVTGVKGWNSPVMDAAEKLVPKRDPFHSWAAKAKNVLIGSTGLDRETFTRENLYVETLFEKIPDSRSLNVPAYDTNAGIEVWSWVLDRYGIEHAEREAEKEFRQRREEFMDTVGGGHRFLMAQFHYLDWMNHMFGDTLEDEEKLRDAYEKVDRFAGEVLEAGEGRFDTIIFMSDHGLPTVAAHNENAFYSCNHELFPETTPHITDFHDKILDLTGGAELDGVEV